MLPFITFPFHKCCIKTSGRTIFFSLIFFPEHSSRHCLTPERLLKEIIQTSNWRNMIFFEVHIYKYFFFLRLFIVWRVSCSNFLSLFTTLSVAHLARIRHKRNHKKGEQKIYPHFLFHVVHEEFSGGINCVVFSKVMLYAHNSNIPEDCWLNYFFSTTYILIFIVYFNVNVTNGFFSCHFCGLSLS